VSVVHDLTAWIDGLPPWAVYLLLGLAAAIETALLIGLFLPTEPVLIAAGVLTTTGHIELTTALIVGTGAALIGDSTAYLLGKRRSARIHTGFVGRRVGEKRWKRAEKLFTKGRGVGGGTTVMIGRWVAFARTLTPRLAGASGMKYRWFLPWNAIGVLVWVPGSIYLGHVAGTQASKMQSWIGFTVFAIVVVALAVTTVVRRRRRKQRDSQPDSQPENAGEGTGENPPLVWETRGEVSQKS
jgi:undecaprenyl-diphosphatase